MTTSNININFEKNFTLANGSEVEGSICVRNCGGDWMYLACTLTASKWFKTLKGAEKFMAARGYKEA